MLNENPEVVKAAEALSEALAAEERAVELLQLARHRLTTAERIAVESGNLNSKDLGKARQAVTDAESTRRVAEDLLHERRIQLQKIRGKTWDEALLQSRNQWRDSADNLATRLATSIQSMEDLQSVELAAARLLGSDELPPVGRTQLIPKLKDYQQRLTAALRKESQP